jgi:molecular chaperone DnaK
MVNDAEAHADEDKKFQELVGARNQADSLIHSTRKAMDDAGDDNVDAEEKSAIESAIAVLEEAMKGDDAADIEEKTKALGEASGKMAERMYAQSGAEEGAAPEADAAAQDDDVVDAEFEEVDDKK